MTDEEDGDDGFEALCYRQADGYCPLADCGGCVTDCELHQFDADYWRWPTIWDEHQIRLPL